MALRVAINGLGRIGRCVLRAFFEYNQHWDIDIVAVNGPASIDAHQHLLRFDSVHGRFEHDVKPKSGALVIDGYEIPVYHERDPLQLPWKELGVDVVLECTGKFRSHDQAGLHLKAGAKKVLISAPSPDPDVTVVFGVNNADLTPKHKIISVGSCTTNCLAPIAKILNNVVGIEKGFMTTIHAYTGDQNLVDGSHKDPRRARAAALNMAPTSTGAAKALGQVLPDLEGKIDGVAIRVPTPNVSLVDLSFLASRKTSTEEICNCLIDAASVELQGILGLCEEPLVSSDFNHTPESAIFDAPQTCVSGDNFVRVAAWYDNEWGFSCRMLDVAALTATR